VLQGDANTRYFHRVKNGSRRKCYIFSLETEEGEIYEPVEFRKHVEGYYKVLFGIEERGSMRLQEDMLIDFGSLSMEEENILIEPFSESEIKMLWKSNTGPGPDGLTTIFYKSFWEQVNALVVEMFGKFYNCDRTTSEMRGLSPKIISGDSRRSENAQTHTHKHTVPHMKFKLKLLQIKCHVIGFTKDIAQNVLQKIIRVFAEAFVSHDRHTFFALEENGPPRTTYTCKSQ
jgi:hypothetical protein